METKINNYRKQIDLIDHRVINLLSKRMSVVKKIGEWKKKNGLPPLDKTRWLEVLADKMKKAEKLNIDQTMVKKIYEAIHKEALKIEKQI